MEGSRDAGHTGVQSEGLLDDPVQVLHLVQVLHRRRSFRSLEDALLFLVSFLLRGKRDRSSIKIHYIILNFIAFLWAEKMLVHNPVAI